MRYQTIGEREQVQYSTRPFSSIGPLTRIYFARQPVVLRFKTHIVPFCMLPEHEKKYNLTRTGLLQQSGEGCHLLAFNSMFGPGTAAECIVASIKITLSVHASGHCISTVVGCCSRVLEQQFQVLALSLKIVAERSLSMLHHLCSKFVVFV